MDILEKLSQAVIEGDSAKVKILSRESIGKVNALKAIEKGLAKGLIDVGQKFEREEAFLTDLMIASEAMKVGVSILEKELTKNEIKEKVSEKIIIGTVAGDIHDIGKKIFGTLLMVNNFEVIDLGIDVRAEDFIKKIKETGTNLLGLSALLTTTLQEQKNVIEALKKAGIRDKVKVIIGGAPVSERWAEEIGADAFATDASTGVTKIKELIKRS